MGKCWSDQCIFVEYASFWEYIVDTAIPSYVLQLIPRSQWLLKDEMQQRQRFKSPLYDYALQIVFAGPYPRTDLYLSFDVNSIKKKIIKWATPIIYALRFDELQIQTDLINSFVNIQKFTLLIQMAVIIIIALLSCVSILLIYSQLMISVESRSFEMGILRMVGFDRVGIIGVLVTQSLLYSIPGIIFGLLFAIIINYFGMQVFEDISSIPLSRWVPVFSIVVSILISVIISLIASIFPIRHALKQNLHDSVDCQHNKGSTVKITIERAEQLQKRWSLLISGALLVVLGGGIYILLPISLMSWNLSLMAFVLISILMMVLIGLVLLTVNFEFVFEKIVAYVFLIWETKVVKFIALKNLTAHRIRNRKTTLLFSITLSFITFLNVIASIAMSMLVDFNYNRYGGDLCLIADTGTGLFSSGIGSDYSPLASYIGDPQVLEYDLMSNFGDIIETLAWASPPLGMVYPQIIKTSISNIGRTHSFNHKIYATTSNFMDNIRQQNLIISESAERKSIFKPSNGDSPIKQLYTSRTKMFSAVLSNGFRNTVGVQINESVVLSITPINQNTPLSIVGTYALYVESKDDQPVQLQQTNGLKKFLIHPSTYMFSQPFFNNPSETIDSSSNAEVPISVPTYLSLFPDGQQDYDDLQWKYLIIRLKEKGKEQQRIKKETSDGQMFEIWNYFKVWSLDESTQIISEATNIINYGFMAITALVIFYSLFSLIASMHANILEQKKEIGIERALGIKRFQLVRVYIEEAFILVISASVMGMIVGIIVGYILTSQIGMLEGIPIQFVFPWQVALVSIVSSIIVSIIASTGPAWRVVNSNIVTTMKTT